MRARITRELIGARGFGGGGRGRLARRRAHRPLRPPPARRRRRGREERAFTRFPTWMWRNREVADVRRVAARAQCRRRAPERRVGFYGLDLYSLLHLDRARCCATCDDGGSRRRRAWRGALRLPDALGAGSRRLWARRADRQLSRSARTPSSRCSRPARRRLELRARATASASSTRCRTPAWWPTPSATTGSCTTARTSRGTCATSTCSRHCSCCSAFRGAGSRGGGLGAQLAHRRRRAPPRWRRAASSTSASLAREAFGDDAYLVGFGTDHGTVAAAQRAGTARCEVMAVRPAHPESYERLFHDAEVPAFRLRAAPSRGVPRSREELEAPRLERAIGVIYRPETELQSHYFQAVLPGAVRRVRLVRRDPGGDAAGSPAAGSRRRARNLPLRLVSLASRAGW